MKTRTLKELLLYNYRYWLGYSIVIGFIVYFLGWKLGSLTNGISAQELAVAAQNSSLKEILSNPVYPLHSLLQWLSIKLLGIDALSLRLSSAVLGLFVAFFLYQLLRRWFGKSTALLSTAIFISADWFLFIARLSTGGIEFSFWLSLALLCFTKLLERKNKWLLLYAVALCGLLFMPFGIYAVATLIASLFACRVFRERAADTSLLLKSPAVLVFILAVAGVGLLTYRNIEFGKGLLGLQELPSILDYFKNVFINTSAVAVVLPNSNPIISPSGIFFVRFFELIFISFGVMMLWRTRVNRLNLTVLALSVVLALASGFSAGSRGGGLVLIPAAIFMTAGIRHFQFRWQRTFPKNPYARIAAVIPLTLLFFSVVALHYVSYFRLWPAQPATATVFSSDLQLAVKVLDNKQFQNKTCYVETTDPSIQKLLTASKPSCQPMYPNETSAGSPQQFAASILRPQAAVSASFPSANIQPLANSRNADNIRWLVVTQ